MWADFWVQLGIAGLLFPFWGLAFVRMVFEFLRIYYLLLGEKFGEYELYKPRRGA